MVRRVLRDLGNKKNIVVLNDEAHHCYMALERDAETGDEAKAARVWLDGLRWCAKRGRRRAVYDFRLLPSICRVPAKRRARFSSGWYPISI